MSVRCGRNVICKSIVTCLFDEYSHVSSLFDEYKTSEHARDNAPFRWRRTEEVCLEEVRAGMDDIVRRACDSSHGRLGLTCLRFLSFFFIV